MASGVKRRYSSEWRAAQARETRRVVVAAAAELFVERGFGRTTVDDIAARAGVSRKTVFTAVGGKLEMLKLALDWATVGDDAPLALLQRPALDPMKHASDADAILHGWVDVVTSIAARLAGLSAALAGAAAVDDQARRLWEDAQSQRLRGAQAFIDQLTAHAKLPADVTRQRGTDIIWLYSDPAIYRRLVLERGWTGPQFQEWLFHTVRQQLHGQ